MIPRRTTRGARPRARGRAEPSTRRSVHRAVVEMHREIFRRNREQINEAVSGYSPAFRAYEREAADRVRTYQRRASFSRLDRAIGAANVVYVGDYHTLPQAQRGFLRLLRRLSPRREVVVALEFVQGRHQPAIDAYMRGDLDDDAFLAAIKHVTHWIFGGWQSFRPIFQLAREQGYRVIGIDTLGRGPAGATLHARDGYAARRIAGAMREADPRRDPLVMVLIGELHVAPPHLPLEVERTLGHQGPEHRPLVIYQNCEEIYWSLEERGIEMHTELVEVSPGEFALMNTPPIVCQQSFLNWLHAEDDGLQWEAPEENFKEFVRLIAAFFDLPVGDAADEAEVASVVDLSFLRRLKQRGDFSAEDMEKIQAQILSSESYYIPRAKMVYLGNLSVNHASEEATHFLRHMCSQSHEPRMLVDAFYWRCIEEAVGFLGSKVINHKRKCAHLPAFQQIRRSRKASPFEREVARLVLKHARMESGGRVRGASAIFECEADLFNAVTHAIGYILGDQLYYALISGVMTRGEIRELFYDSLEDEGDALTTYLYLRQRTAGVRLPERM